MEHRIVLTICGEEYTFIAEESDAYMERVAAYVDQKMSEVMEGSKVGRTDAAVLTAANITDELFRTHSYLEQIRRQLQEYVEELGRSQAETSELKREQLRLQQKLEKLERQKGKSK